MAITPETASSVTSTPAPDVSALAQPGSAVAAPAAAPTTAPAAAPSAADPASVQAAMAPFQQKEQEATQKAADLANQPAAVPVSGPHARLIGMIQGLALGADAFGKAIATHGKEGGIEEVQQVQAQQQEQKIRAQQASVAQKNTQIQQQLMVVDTNHKLAQNVLLMATIPNELTKAGLEIKGAQQGQAITAADFAASHGGMTADQFNQQLSGTTPASATGANAPSSFFT